MLRGLQRSSSRCVLSLLLVSHATPCRWTTSPGGCYLVTDVRATQWGCESACSALNATLACPISTEEIAAMAEVTSGDAWLGAYKDETGGWLCASGGAFTSSHWAPAEPSVPAFECARIASDNLHKRGRWESAHCSEALRCVCVHGFHTSIAYNATRLALNAAVVSAKDADQVKVMITVSVAIFLGVWVVVLVCVKLHLRRENGRRQMTAHASSERTMAPVVHANHDTVVSDSELVEQAQRKLGTARDAANRVRHSVNFAATVAISAAILVAFPSIAVLATIGLPFGPAGVAYVAILAVAVPAQLDATDARKTRATLGGFLTVKLPPLVGLFSGLAALAALTPNLFGLCSTRKPACALGARLLGGLSAAIGVTTAGIIAAHLPLFYATRDKALPPLHELLRQQKLALTEDGRSHPCTYRRDPFYLLEGAGYYATPTHAAMAVVFCALQASGVVAGACFACTPVLSALDIIPASYTWGGFFPTGLAFALLYPAAFAPPSRRAIAGWLGRLRTSGEERQAAVVAGLMGGWTAAKALTIARSSFSAVDFRVLFASDLSSNMDTGLNERVVRLALGKCDTFMSHSWHDDAAGKWATLQNWAASFEAANGRSPFIWLDKACIDQKDIEASLACLPIYLAGCQGLLVLAGTTYIERLWCIVEVFTFVRMGGELSRVEVAIFGNATSAVFEQFTVENAKCFKAEDKAKLLTAIETAFGAYAPFNALVRSMLAAASTDKAPMIEIGVSSPSAQKRISMTDIGRINKTNTALIVTV